MLNPFAWLAGKLAAPVLAAIAVVAILAAGVQTVRLDGVHVFGLTILSGAIDDAAAANKKADAATQNAGAYKHASDSCNTSVDDLAHATSALGKTLDAKFAALAPALAKMNANAAHVLALKPAPGQDKCDFAFQVLTGRIK